MSPGLASRAPSFVVLPMIVLLAGCGSARLRVIQPADHPAHYAAVSIVPRENTADVPPEQAKVFAERLRGAMYKDKSFAEGGDLLVEYRVLVFDPGDRGLRYLVGFGAGEGEMVVETTYRDAGGRELSKIETSGRVTMGWFGGDFKDAYDRIIEKVVQFTKSTFDQHQAVAAGG